MFDSQENDYYRGNRDALLNEETQDWVKLNALLRQHGLTPISFMYHSDVDHDTCRDYILMTFETSQNVRKAIQILMKDSNRRQDLVQDMIMTNSQLREELKLQTLKNKENEGKIEDLKVKLNNDQLVVESNSDTLKKKYEKLKKVNSELTLKCANLENEIKILNEKLQSYEKEDSRKEIKAKELFEKYKGRPGKLRLDDELLTVIDDYERQIKSMKRDFLNLRNVEKDTFDIYRVSLNEPSSNVKQLLRSYEKKLQDSCKKIKELTATNESLKLDLHAKDVLLKSKTTEKLLKGKITSTDSRSMCSSTSSLSLHHQPNKHPPPLSSSLSSPPLDHHLHLHPHHQLSTRLIDLKRQPASLCYKYLELTCSILGVCDLQDIQPTIQRLNKNSSMFNQLELFVREVHQLTTRYNLPKPRNKNCSCHDNNNNNVDNKAACSDKNCIMFTLEHWVNQIKHLKALQRSIKNLSEKLFPWKPIRNDDDDDVKVCSTLELVDIVDELVADGCHNNVCKHSDVSSTGKDQLIGIVKHFQELFDVPQVAGVYTRMSHLYRKLNENYNVMINIKDILGLDKSSNSTSVLDAISKLLEGNKVQVEELQLVQQRHLSQKQEDDLEKEKLLEKLEEQNEFCTVFHDTMQIIMEMLGVGSVVQIVPTLEQLLLRTQQKNTQ